MNTLMNTLTSANIACCTRDNFLASQLGELIAKEGFDCEHFKHEAALMRMLRHRGGIDLVIIDLGHDPAIEESVYSWLGCRSGEPMPVMLIAPHWHAQRVAAALDMGADDCVARPFDGIELIARMKAVLRRSGAASSAPERIERAGFVLLKNDGLMLDGGKPLELTPREFSLAWLLFANPGQRLSREAISLAIWGTDKDIANRTIEQHVYKLRKKIGLTAGRGVMIRTTYGQGYRLEMCDAPVRRTVVPASTPRLLRLDAERNGTTVSVS